MKTIVALMRTLFIASLVAVPVGAFGIFLTWLNSSPVQTDKFIHPYRLISRAVKLFPVYLSDAQVTSYETFHFITMGGLVVLLVVSALILGLKKFS